MKISTERLLPMEGARNIRDLGGYAARDGVTRPNVFFRGDSTADLTEEDVARLRERNLTLVIDLRSTLETVHAPSRLLRPGILYRNIPMLDHINSGPMAGKFPASMGEMYMGLLEHSREDYREIFTLLSQSQGAALFHCTAGKDRTGMVAMLLLLLAGVPEKQVAEDYVATDAFLRDSFEAQIQAFARKGIRLPAHLLRADRENIVFAMEGLKERFGGAERYLLDCGVTPDKLKAILERFVQKQK